MLTSCLLGNFACFLSSADFLNLTFCKMLSGIPSNSLKPDQARSSVETDVGPNCLQRQSAVSTLVGKELIR